MSDQSLHDLAARLARGEEAAFAELYDCCADRLHRYLVGRLYSHDAASDVLQASFLRAVKSRKRFRGVENPIAYMYEIARNEATRAAAKNGPRNQQTVRQIDPIVDGGDSTCDDAEAATAALARLDDDDRELVELKIYAGLTFREIAEVTGRPPATVATRYRRAIESLRGWLTKQFR